MVRKTVVVSAMILAVAVFVSSCNGTKEDVYRPMCYFNNSLMWEEKIAEIDLNNFEYIGTICSCVGADKKPEKNFECNYESWLGAEIYRDENNSFYIKFLNEATYKLRAAGDS